MLNLQNIGVIFGGKSPEHDVSVISGLSVINNINTQKYNVNPIYISQEGIWYKVTKNILPTEIERTKQNLFKNIKKIENIIEYLKYQDKVFPVLHGNNGEDGAIQGMLKLIGVKYIGSKILASSIGMDKIYAKIIFGKAGIPQAKSIYLKVINENYIYIDNKFNETKYTLQEIAKKIVETIQLPLFVKPSNSGSSLGINKAHTIEELENYIQEAAKFDYKIIIEETIKGRELECAVLGNEEVQASEVGEILPADEFYSYNAKYNNIKSKTITKAEIPQETKEKIQKLAIKAFKAIDGAGLSRVDFFWNEKKDVIYINEINTIPGFTPISMYTKLWEECGINYKKLLEKN